jgi:hypothetical protein
MSQQDLLKFVARNLRNERGINVDSIQFNMKLDEHGISRVDEIRFDGTETTDESEEHKNDDYDMSKK